MADQNQDRDAVAINEVQLLLAEERTSLAVMRTGIAVLALPLSVFSLLIATSKYYDPLGVLQFLLPVALLSAALLILGGYLVTHSLFRIRRVHRMIHRVRLEHSELTTLLEPAD